MRFSRRGGRGGFTLTELASVMAVIVILGGMAVSSLGGLADSRRDVAATRIRTVLVYAQEWAMGSSNDTWVVLDAGTDSVTVYVEDPANPGKAGRVALADPLTRGDMTLQLGDSGVGIASVSIGGTSEVQFDALGAPYDASGTALAADGTITVTAGPTVRITKGTGLIVVD